MRVAHAGLNMAAGPQQYSNVLLNPTVIGAFLRLTWGLTFPCLLTALTIQELLWIQICVALKSLRTLRADTNAWLPRLKWIFYPALAFFFVMECVTQILLTLNIYEPWILLVYRALVLLVVCTLWVVAIVFGLQLLRCLSWMNAGLAASKTDHLLGRARKTLARFLYLTLVILLVAVVLLCALIIPGTTTHPFGFWTLNFLILFTILALTASMFLSFFEMMRARVRPHLEGRPLPPTGTDTAGRTDLRGLSYTDATGLHESLLMSSESISMAEPEDDSEE
jgi:hypothetical protein